MAFYGIYYLSILFLLISDHFLKNIRFFLYLALCIIIIISGTRYNTGYDFYNYHVFYTHNLTDGLEPLFKLSVYLLNFMSPNSQLMFFSYSLATVIIIYVAITKTTKYIKTSLIFLLLIPGLYLNTFSIIRQGIAEAFFLLAVSFLIYENKKTKFWVYSLISIGFHYSAIIPILLTYLLKRLCLIRLPTASYICLLAVSIVFYRLDLSEALIGLAPGKFSAYALMIQKTSLLKIVISNIFIVVLLYYNKQYIKSKNDLVLLNLLFIGVIILNIFADFTPVTRLSYYFLVFQILLVPKFIYSFKSNNIRILVLSAFLIYYSAMFTNALKIDIESEGQYKMTPYQNYFFRTE